MSSLLRRLVGRRDARGVKRMLAERLCLSLKGRSIREMQL